MQGHISETAEAVTGFGLALVVLSLVSLLVAIGVAVATNQQGNPHWLGIWIGSSLLGLAAGFVLALVGAVWNL